jgi:hypothetical protein
VDGAGEAIAAGGFASASRAVRHAAMSIIWATAISAAERYCDHQLGRWSLRRQQRRRDHSVTR